MCVYVHMRVRARAQVGSRGRRRGVRRDLGQLTPLLSSKMEKTGGPERREDLPWVTQLVRGGRVAQPRSPEFNPKILRKNSMKPEGLFDLDQE